MLRDLIVTANSGDKHHAFQDYVVLGIAVDEVVVQILNQVGAMHHFVPLVCVHVHHGTEEFNLQICVFSAVLRHNDVLLEVALKSLDGRWRKLGDVATHLEKEGIVKFDRTVNQLIKLLILSETLGITTVG